MTTTQRIQQQLPTGYTVRPRRQKAGVIGAVPQWIITGPWGDEAVVRGDDDALVALAVESIQAAYARRMAPKPEPVAIATPAPVAAATARPARAYCEHSDIDNNGHCYACGHYSRSHDVGQFF